VIGRKRFVVGHVVLHILAHVFKDTGDSQRRQAAPPTLPA
jgi:hypothetical protein